MMDKFRDPKWMAIGFAAAVVVGVVVKVVANSGAEASPERVVKRATSAAAPELGRYELASSSWAPKRTQRINAVSEEKAPAKHAKIEERRWTGICVAVKKGK